MSSGVRTFFLEASDPPHHKRANARRPHGQPGAIRPVGAHSPRHTRGAFAPTVEAAHLTLDTHPHQGPRRPKAQRALTRALGLGHDPVQETRQKTLSPISTLGAHQPDQAGRQARHNTPAQAARMGAAPPDAGAPAKARARRVAPDASP